jgi:hypothetical protein
MGGWVGEGWVVYEVYEEREKGKSYAVFYFAGKRILIFLHYEVFTWGEKYKALIYTTLTYTHITQIRLRKFGI